MSDLFSIYEDSLNIVLRNITTVIEHMNHLSKEKTESALNDANNNLKEAERILKQMDLEVSSEKNQNSNFLSVKYRNYKSEVEMIKKRFLKMQENYINKKSNEAFLIEGIEDLDSRKSQKRKLIDNEEIAWDSHDNLESGKRKAIEMEKISYDIMLNLDRQTNQIKNVRENVFQMNSQVDKSDSLLKRMLRRENRNRIYIIVFSITLIIAFIVFLYFFKFN